MNHRSDSIPLESSDPSSRSLQMPDAREQSLFMTGTGAEEIWEGLWKNTVPEEGLSKSFYSREGPEIFCVLQIQDQAHH